MELSTLKKIRTLYPGSYIFMQILLHSLINADKPITFSGLMDFSTSTENLFPVCLILGFGILYYAFECRSILWNPILNRISENINKKLLSIAGDESTEKLSEQQKNSMKNLFYHFIGKDETLKTKSKNVMYNGAMLTSVLDTIILTVPILFIDICISVNRSTTMATLWINLFILIICCFTRSRLIKKHLKLSNDQLSYIEDNYAENCSDAIKKILNK